ncbi:transporter substrate-binding domain-containing protein [Aestuariibacter sp. AA17]|uniref:Transporter substrate-binding domain-containing protein n=1 Tax=Fluctibacter corallii TaxID=2984329 RepID=A0ABT3A3I2_9ALTE|nr:transporter substrate-binding domain-containing protein [Aestuariibacter sp. AA17]MCV2883236.1 transporter substrate-binding domain-containing protein [Aestuariibacter sp. AA17]
MVSANNNDTTMNHFFSKPRNPLLCVGMVLIFFVLFPAYAAKEVTIAVYEDHEKYKAASRAYGISWILLQHAAAQSDIVLIPQASTWEGGIRRLKAGKVDLLFMAIKSAEREKWAHFSAPLVSLGSAIFTRPDNPVTSIPDIDIQTSSIGVIEDSIQANFAQRIGFENIYSTVDRLQLYKMLNSGRLDYLFFSIGIIDMHCQYHHEPATYDCLKQVGNVYDRRTVHVVSAKKSKKGKRILTSIDRNLEALAVTPFAKSLFDEFDAPVDAYDYWLNQINEASDTTPEQANFDN